MTIFFYEGNSLVHIAFKKAKMYRMNYRVREAASQLGYVLEGNLYPISWGFVSEAFP